MRGRAQSDAGPPPVVPETRRDKYQRPFPVKAGTDRELPKGLPPTPPSEPESYTLNRTRSRSQPAARGSTARSSGGSSDYAPPPRPRLDTVRDEDDSGSSSATEMRRAKSMGGRGRMTEEKVLSRSQSKRERGRRDDGNDIYDLYNDYYDEKPMRSVSTRRPPARALTRSRTSSSSRGRSREDEDDYSQRYSEEEDDEFEMVTPMKRTEISKVTSPQLPFPLHGLSSF